MIRIQMTEFGEIKRFCVWLRKRYTFPMRVMVYVKNQEQIRAHEGERVYGTFFAPYDHSLEPYIRIAVGDYISLVEKRGEMNAVYALLECLAHELTHYYQWLAEWEMNNVLEEKQARYCARQVVRRYWNEFFE